MLRTTFAVFLCFAVFLSAIPTVFAETDAERKARLETELRRVEAEIAAQQVLVDGKRGERRSLERDDRERHAGDDGLPRAGLRHAGRTAGDRRR